MHVLTCLFADNLCEGPGAIVCNGFSTSEISHCTFVAHPTLPRPAIAVLLGSRISLRNCVFAPGGGAPYPSAFVHVAAAQIFQDDIDSSNLFSNGQSGISVTSSPSFPVSVRAGDPAFVLPRGTDNDPATWRDNNYHLLASSPAIDTAGSSNEYPSNDYRDLDGTSPFDAPTVVNHGTGLTPYLDLGCYEFTERLCPADFNASGSLTPADIYDFLNAWLAADPRADFNGYGLSAQDIFDFLGAWFAGC